MKTSDFDYPLPHDLIAQRPVEPRDHSRLMAVSRHDGTIRHYRFDDLPSFLRPGDALVMNDSRVFPARLQGTRLHTGGAVEVLLLSRVAPGAWRALVRPGRRMREGAEFQCTRAGAVIRGRVAAVRPDGSRTVELEGEEHIHAVGQVPLPPYIHEPLQDPDRYQTVYARAEGSVAAPTAGLHFTPALMDRIRAMGVATAFVTLHVGWDSFRPVQGEDPSAHELQSEHWTLTAETAAAVNDARGRGGRVVCVGTTTVRLLEHAASLCGYPGRPLTAGSGWAGLFITPGYRFRAVDALVTNFHLPRSTLLMLTCAFGGRELLLRAYAEAVALGYRFYSLGDAMLVL